MIGLFLAIAPKSFVSTNGPMAAPRLSLTPALATCATGPVINPQTHPPMNTISELQSMIEGTLTAFAHNPKLRTKALKAIQWRFRGPNGEYVASGERLGDKVAFCPQDRATIFDGRDNEAHKLSFYQTFLGPLTIEILPQQTTA